MSLTLKDLAVEHDYHCSENNYYSNDAGEQYDTVDEFLSEFADADIDMNLVFRWDVRDRKEHGYSGEGYYMEIFMMQQRKGIFFPVFIEHITEEDVPKILEYLKPHLAKLKSIWKPLE